VFVRVVAEVGEGTTFGHPPPGGDGGEVVAWIVGRIDCVGRKPVARWDLIVGVDDDVLACRRGELWYGGFGLLVDWG
jgi:hypothetical protein